ncbi:MAG: tetratricopeptide repeat protein [Phycisphaerae bacterium]|jgi:tetratricopeptide (TPR) repeat protein
MRRFAFCTRWPALILLAGVPGWTLAATPPPPASAPATRATTQPAADLVAAAEGRLAAGEPRAAVALLARAVAAAPDEPDYVLKLSAAQLAAGLPDEAETTLKRGVQRFARHVPLWSAWVDLALNQQRWTTTLARAQAALATAGPSPELHFRLAQTYFHLGQVLGAVEVRTVDDGRPGQFAGRWLLLERRGPHQFLCCPEESALNQVRRALDGGLSAPAAHVLHARLWQAMGKAQIGFSLLRSREAVLLAEPDAATLEALADLALEADALDDYLRYCHLLASATPERRAAILGEAYLAVADRYGQRGDEALYENFCYRALELRPDDTDLLWQVARASWAAGRHEEAARLYRRLLALQPDHPQRQQILEHLASLPDVGEPPP